MLVLISFIYLFFLMIVQKQCETNVKCFWKNTEIKRWIKLHNCMKLYIRKDSDKRFIQKLAGL